MYTCNEYTSELKENASHKPVVIFYFYSYIPFTLTITRAHEYL